MEEGESNATRHRVTSNRLESLRITAISINFEQIAIVLSLPSRDRKRPS